MGGQRDLPNRPRSRLLRLFVATTIAAVALEGGLQLAAFGAWLLRRPAAARPAGPVLLCIGDSVTFGLGVPPEAAYPAVLQERLATAGLAWSVVNRGIPGNDSADVATRLPALLDELRPDAVCLLVGWNDRWSRPTPLPAEVLHGSGGGEFVWRWRTGRLWALLMARRDGSDVDAHGDEMPFLGIWSVDGQQFEFRADGSAWLGTLPARWRVEGDRLHLTPEGSPPFVVRWSLAEGALDFMLPGWDRHRRARRGPPEAIAAAERVAELLERDQFDAAQAAVAALPDGAETRAARARLARGLADAGRGEAAASLRRELEHDWREHHEPNSGEALACVQASAGERDAAAALARSVLVAAPARARCWRLIGDAASPAARALVADEIARVAAGESSPWRRAELALERAVVLASVDAPAAVSAWIAARAGGVGADASIAGMVHAVARGADGEALLAAARAVAEPATDATLLRDLRRAVVDEREVYATLEGHVAAIVARVQASSARAFVLGYPVPLARHDEAMRRVASACGVPFVPTHAAFVARTAGSPREQWFQDPIHPTAKGSELLATIVAEAIGPGLRAPR